MLTVDVFPTRIPGEKRSPHALGFGTVNPPTKVFDQVQYVQSLSSSPGNKIPRWAFEFGTRDPSLTVCSSFDSIHHGEHDFVDIYLW